MSMSTPNFDDPRVAYLVRALGDETPNPVVHRENLNTGWIATVRQNGDVSIEGVRSGQLINLYNELGDVQALKDFLSKYC